MLRQRLSERTLAVTFPNGKYFGVFLCLFAHMLYIYFMFVNKAQTFAAAAVPALQLWDIVIAHSAAFSVTLCLLSQALFVAYARLFRFCYFHFLLLLCCSLQQRECHRVFVTSCTVAVCAVLPFPDLRIPRHSRRQSITGWVVREKPQFQTSFPEKKRNKDAGKSTY